jgi:hypothetical protein
MSDVVRVGQVVPDFEMDVFNPKTPKPQNPAYLNYELILMFTVKSLSILLGLSSTIT